MIMVSEVKTAAVKSLAILDPFVFFGVPVAVIAVVEEVQNLHVVDQEILTLDIASPLLPKLSIIHVLFA
jgi:hypothetical protein